MKTLAQARKVLNFQLKEYGHKIKDFDEVIIDFRKGSIYTIYYARYSKVTGKIYNCTPIEENFNFNKGHDRIAHAKLIGKFSHIHQVTIFDTFKNIEGIGFENLIPYAKLKGGE